jgi:hypothetical protein
MLKRLAHGLFVGVIIGVVCTYAVLHHVTHNWIELTKEHHGLAYSNEGFVDPT